MWMEYEREKQWRSLRVELLRERLLTKNVWLNIHPSIRWLWGKNTTEVDDHFFPSETKSFLPIIMLGIQIWFSPRLDSVGLAEDSFQCEGCECWTMDCLNTPDSSPTLNKAMRTEEQCPISFWTLNGPQLIKYHISRYDGRMSMFLWCDKPLGLTQLPVLTGVKKALKCIPCRRKSAPGGFDDHSRLSNGKEM